MSQTILENVRRIIAEQLGLSYEEVTTEANLRLDLGLDSLDLIELTMRFARTFNISYSSEAKHTLTTIGEVVDFLESI